MNSKQDPIPNKTFLDLYASVKEYSKHNNLNFQQAILKAITLASRGYTNSQVLSKLSSPTSSTSCRQSEVLTSGSAVWLVVGQTGQGKSSLINAICGQQVAQEGRGNHSLTSEVKLYPVKRSNLCLIDTPGFQDTRLEMKDEKIADEIVKLVQKKLEANANIEAILLMWNPARFMRLTLDAMFDKLCTCFGLKALDSVVFVINEVTKKWDQECEDAVDELLDDLESRELDIPVVRLDAKMFTRKDFDTLNEACQDVEPYKEADFEKYRKTYYYQKFAELKTIEDNKRREQKIIEERAREKEQRKAQERERMLRQNAEEERRQAEEKERRYKQEYEEEQRKAQERERMLRQKGEEEQRQAEEKERRYKQEYEEEKRKEQKIIEDRARKEEQRKVRERERMLRQKDEEERRQVKERERRYKQEYEEEERKAQERERILRQKVEEERRQAEEKERRYRQEYEEEQRKAQERERLLIQKNEEDQRRAKEEEIRLKQENEKLLIERLQQQNTSYCGNTSSLSQFLGTFQGQESVPYYWNSLACSSPFLSQPLGMFQGQESVPYYGNSSACSSPFNYSSFNDFNNYSTHSNINDNVSGRTTRSGTHDHRDLSYRVVPHLTMSGAPDMRFKCNKKK